MHCSFYAVGYNTLHRKRCLPLVSLPLSIMPIFVLADQFEDQSLSHFPSLLIVSLCFLPVLRGNARSPKTPIPLVNLFRFFSPSRPVYLDITLPRLKIHRPRDHRRVQVIDQQKAGKCKRHVY